MAKDKTVTLRRLEKESRLARKFGVVADFDVTRRDPIDTVSTRDGRALRVIGGGASGDSYYLVGGGEDGPVLYVSGDGSAALLGANLLETLQDLVQAPYWQDLVHTSDDKLAARVEQLDEEWNEDVDKFAKYQRQLLDELGLAAADPVRAFRRIKAAAADTAGLGLHGGPDDLDFELIVE